MKDHNDTPHSRSSLHFNRFDAFKNFLLEHGWVEEPCKGEYEKFRARHTHFSEPLLLHARNSATEHFTTWGVSEQMRRAFVRAQKSGNTKPPEHVWVILDKDGDLFIEPTEDRARDTAKRLTISESMAQYAPYTVVEYAAIDAARGVKS